MRGALFQHDFRSSLILKDANAAWIDNQRLGVKMKQHFVSAGGRKPHNFGQRVGDDATRRDDRNSLSPRHAVVPSRIDERIDGRAGFARHIEDSARACHRRIGDGS